MPPKFYPEGDIELAEWRRNYIPINEHMPVKFSNGSVIDSFTGECAGCSKRFAIINLRGQIVYHGKFVEIDALGYCSHCSIFTPIRYDVWDDLTLVGRVNGFGLISTWQQSRA